MADEWCSECLEKKVLTPIEVKDALLKCFLAAHKEAVEEATFDMNIPEDKKVEVITGMVKKAFVDTKGDFDKPTKKSILAAMNQLKAIAKYFRNQDIIERHYSIMTKLIDKLN